MAQPTTVLVSNATPTPTPTPTPTALLVSVVLTPSTVTQGQVSQAVAADTAGNVLTGVVWTMEHTFMAGIDQTGLVTGTVLGGQVAGRASANTAVIATLNGVTKTAMLTVHLERDDRRDRCGHPRDKDVAEGSQGNLRNNRVGGHIRSHGIDELQFRLLGLR
jgi:hypothetical protein